MDSRHCPESHGDGFGKPILNGHSREWPPLQVYRLFRCGLGGSDSRARKRLLAPFLGKFYGDCLEDGEIALKYGPDGFKVVYYNLALPVLIDTYPGILKDLDRLKDRLSEDHPDFIKLLGILYVVKSLSRATIQRSVRAI